MPGFFTATKTRHLAQALPPWMLGIAISTPIVAILQGALLLAEYRANHGKAPRPAMPCRGVMIATQNSNDGRWSIGKLGRRRRSVEQPLRLLVIGDSLAAGVGMSESSVPALPESIAQALSKANGGRAVYWTCVGTPGSSSSELVKQIHHLEDMPPPLLLRLAEWQAQSRQRARQRITDAQRKARDWWERHQEPLEVDEGEEGTVNGFLRWWKLSRLGIERDWRNFRRVLNQEENMHARLERNVTTMVERNALDPNFVNQYDIAIVLTGLNDLKDSFLPFMMSDKRAKMLQEANKDSIDNQRGGLKGELVRVVQALKGKMKLSLPDYQSTNDRKVTDKTGDDITATSVSQRADQKKSDRRKHQSPLVVFPALPFAPIGLCRRAPLSWFVVPLIRGMDANKQVLAEMYPELVIFVDSGSEVFSDAEAKRGALWEDFQTGRVLLKLTGGSQSMRERVEDLMHKHFKSWVMDAEDDDDNLYFLEADDVAPLSDQDFGSHPGATMVSPDGIHPNDEGYSIWGRYIAQAIMQHWEQQYTPAWRVYS